jgi:CopG family nickel-responsive transcriptional regulator
MKDPLVRFGIALEGSLIREIDAVARERGCSRSRLLRRLARETVEQAKASKGIDSIATLTLVYDHHVCELHQRLINLQHDPGIQACSALHLHLSQDLCLEVVILRGRSDRLQSLADRILALRGVKQGGIEIFAGIDNSQLD